MKNAIKNEIKQLIKIHIVFIDDYDNIIFTSNIFIDNIYKVIKKFLFVFYMNFYEKYQK